MGFLLALSTIGIVSQNIISKQYVKKHQGSIYLFTCLTVLFSAMFFIVTLNHPFEFSWEFIPYSILFAVSYCAAALFTNYAIKSGPLCLTSLFSAYSLMIPTLYGIIMLNEKVSVFKVLGIIILIISIFLANYTPNKNGQNGEKIKITLKWAIFVLITFLGNGMCSTVQKVAFLDLSGKFKSEFMIIALLLSSVIIFIFFMTSERKGFLKNTFSALPFSALKGIANGAVNLFVIALAIYPASIVYPVISAGNIVVMTTLSMTVYREKLSVYQIISTLLGICAIVFLNI